MRIEAEPIVVITNATGALGRSLAMAFCRRGIRVIGFGQSEDLPKDLASTASKGAFAYMRVNVADETEVSSAFRLIGEGWGTASILFNMAQVVPKVDFLQENGSSFVQTISLNLGGMVACTRAVLATMTVTGRGRIINVGSSAATGPSTSFSAYSTSMGAAKTFTQALVADLADRFPDIVVNHWVPGIGHEDWASNGAAETAADWGVELALWGDRSLNGVEFEGNCELVRAQSFKRRVIDTLRGRSRTPRVLGRTDRALKRI